MSEVADKELDRLCEVMHDAYEAEAGRVGWQTQHATRVSWLMLPEENRATMRFAVRALLEHIDDVNIDSDHTWNIEEDLRSAERTLEEVGQLAQEWSRRAPSRFLGEDLQALLDKRGE